MCTVCNMCGYCYYFLANHTHSYYGADDTCAGDAYKYLVGTDQCSSYPDFFDRAVCDEKGTFFVPSTVYVVGAILPMDGY